MVARQETDVHHCATHISPERANVCRPIAAWTGVTIGFRSEAGMLHCKDQIRRAELAGHNPVEWVAYLERVCGSDQELLQEVDSLLELLELF